MELFKKTFPNLYDIYSVLSKKKNLKLLTYFLIINLLFMFVEVIYGLLSNSLGLLTDGAHMLLDCTAVVIGLYSSYLSEFKSNNNYNYGYLRSEILGTFINSVFLFFIAVYIVFESIERFIEPKEIDSENLILVSFLGLVVNIIGLVFAHDHGDNDHDHGHDQSHHHSHEHCHDEKHHHNESSEENEKLKEEKHEHEHSQEKENKETQSHHHHEHKNENIYAIYIHILADTLGSVAVLISSFLVKYYKLYISDPICSLFISAMIIFSTIPVLKNASMSLLHIPNEKIIKKKKKIEQSIKSINCGSDNIKPIIGNFELWQTNSSYFVGEIKIEIDRNVKKDNKDKMLQNENSIFFEVQNKIQGIFKDNKINEYYIEIL
jgi:zinc transporter 5/7